MPIIQPAARMDVFAPLSGEITPVTSRSHARAGEVREAIGIIPDASSSTMYAPVAGLITELLPEKGWLVLTTEQGLCVELSGGHGSRIETRLMESMAIVAGQALGQLSFGQEAQVLSIVVAGPGGEVGFLRKQGVVCAGQDVLLSLVTIEVQEGLVISDPVRVNNAVGLHARPAAALANAAKAYAADVWIMRNGALANAKSLIAVMGLGVKQGDLVRVRARGPEAERAVQELAALIAAGCEEQLIQVHAPALDMPPMAKSHHGGDLYQGVPAAPGLAIGNVFHLRQEEIPVRERGEAPLIERLRFEHALVDARRQLDVLRGKLVESSEAGIFSAHQELLTDPALLEATHVGIERGESAAYAWRAAYSSVAGQFASVADEVLAARANDIRDVGRRVLRLIVGLQEQVLEVPFNTILLAEELTPSDTARLDRGRVLGFCTAGGGTTSHAAILARSLDLPAICGIEDRALNLPDGTPVILDGNRGVLHANPSPEAIATLRDRQQVLARQHEADLQSASRPAVTLDGHRVEVAANIGGLEDAQNASISGSDGVGLLRSEFLFLNRKTGPSEEEQSRIYADIARTLGPRKPLIVRTLDVGGDKPLPYLPLPPEDNPFLGIRGLRLGLAEPELLRTQIRAILRSAHLARMHIMFPMVTSVEEIRLARRIVEEEEFSLGGESRVQIGVMIEVPSAAVLAGHFAREVDFFSIGTNDLTQYTLAMDRGHPKLAKEADALHPGVLQLIAMTIEGAHRHGKWVGVCGSMASDPLAVPLLVGLGVDELSVSVPAVPAIKAQIRHLNRADCDALAQAVLEMGSVLEVRQRLLAFQGAE